MRSVVTLLGVLLAIALGAGVYLHQRHNQLRRAAVEQTREAVLRMQREVRVRAALEQTDVNGRGWPVTIDPAWFGETPPHNMLLDGDRPWLEVASMEEAGLTHPNIRIAVGRKIAAFWYNPANGVVRARAAVEVSDRLTTQTYNRINGAGLASVFEQTGGSRPQVDLAAGEEDAYGTEAMDPTHPREQ